MTTDFTVHKPVTLNAGVRALLFGVFSFAVTMFCLELIKISGAISPLWFSTTLMTAIIFRFPLRQLPLLLAACLAGTMLGNLYLFGIGWPSVKYPLVNLLQAGLGGGLLRLLLNPNNPLDSLLSWSKFIVAGALFTPLAGGLLALALLHKPQLDPLPFYSTWVISEVIGMLALGPVCLLWPRNYLNSPVQQNTLLETLITLIGSLLLCYIALCYLPWPFTFVITILFWCAVRLPRLEAFLVFLANIMLLSLMLALHALDMHDTSPVFNNAAPWLPFLMALLPSHMMVMVMHQAREEKKHIQESETRFRNAMEYSAIGMALVSPDGKFLKVNKALAQLLGYRESDLLKMGFQQITHPDDLNSDLMQVQAVLLGDIESYSMEKRYFRQDGEVVWTLLAVSLVRDADYHPLYFISQIEDITDLKRTQETNRRLMDRITLANEAGGIGVWDWNMKSGAMNWDKRMFEIYQLSGEGKATYLTWANSLHDADRETAIAAFDHAARFATPIDTEFRITTGSGIRYIHAQATIMHDAQGQPERMLGINQDVTRIRLLNDALYQEKERMHITLDAIGEAVISTDEEMNVTFMNPVAERMSGWSQQNAEGKPLSNILRITQGSDGPEMENLLLCAIPASKSTPDFERDLVLHNGAGEQFDVHYSISPLKTLDGDNIGSVMVIQDVSESREMLKRLSYSASHDMLTRLPNRVSFEHQMKRLLLSAAEHQHQHVLAFIDLDRFKAVNDTAGHAAGDALLRELSGVMQQHLRSSDVLARLGGDEFGILLADCSIEQGQPIIERIVHAVNEYRFFWEGRLYRVGASAGLTQIAAGNCQASEVMAQADLACYNAKHNGRGQLAVFESQLMNNLKPALSREDNLQIISQQPMRLLVRPATPPRKPQSVSFYLAEMQLFSPDGHELEEDQFRAGLQDDELLLALDRKLVTEFFSHYASGVVSKALTLVLPLSTMALQNDALINDLLAQMSAHSFPASLLWFSVQTESVLQDQPSVKQNIARLRQAGSRFVLRDFGRNLDTFSRLEGWEVDYLVLNADLVANVHCNLMDEMMVSIIQGHAQRLHIATLAGPVALPVALNTLATIGVDAVWGETIGPREPLSALLVSSYFAIK